MAHSFCCGYSRTAVRIIAVLSALHFMIEAAAIQGDSTLVTSSDPKTGAFFYGLAAPRVTMMSFSAFLLLGTFLERGRASLPYDLFKTCAPWLLWTIVNIVYHIHLVIQLALSTISDFDVTKLGKMTLLMISGMALSYMVWVVVLFMQEDREDRLYDDLLRKLDAMMIRESLNPGTLTPVSIKIIK